VVVLVVREVVEQVLVVPRAVPAAQEHHQA
jgi:hypothetical protein